MGWWDTVSDFAEGTVNVLGDVIEVAAPILGASAAIAGGILLAPVTGGASTIAGIAAASAIAAGTTYVADEVADVMQNADFDGDGSLRDSPARKAIRKAGRNVSRSYAKTFADSNKDATSVGDMSYAPANFGSVTKKSAKAKVVKYATKKARAKVVKYSTPKRGKIIKKPRKLSPNEVDLLSAKISRIPWMTPALYQRVMNNVPHDAPRQPVSLHRPYNQSQPYLQHFAASLYTDPVRPSQPLTMRSDSNVPIFSYR